MSACNKKLYSVTKPGQTCRALGAGVRKYPSVLGSVLPYGAIPPLYPLDAFRGEFGYSDLSANNGERRSGIVGSRSRIVVDGKLDEFLGQKYGRVGDSTAW